MKLLQRTGRYYVWFSTLIFILWGVGLFLTMRYVISHETDERLKDAKKALFGQLTKMESVPDSIVLLDNVIEINPISEFTPFEQYSDTLIWSDMEREHKMAFRKYQYHEVINGRPYRISLSHLRMDTEEMMTTVVLAVFGILGLLLLTINLFNRFLSLRIWQPFYQTIRQIKDFTFDKQEPLAAPQTDIYEFAVLHQAIDQMTSKALSDYQSLKEFTENASHEIQNPLAIIKTEVERLIQQEHWNESERQAIQHIQHAASRLSRLNHSLLLLTRIENRQFTSTLQLNLKSLVENQIDIAEPMITSKNLSVKADLKDSYQAMNPSLAEVLIGNLLGNAIKHNLPDGHITLRLDERQLHISNSGEELIMPSHKLFERFHKSNGAAPSLGLGLAIVREICSSYGFDIRYEYSKNLHRLTVDFE